MVYLPVRGVLRYRRKSEVGLTTKDAFNEKDVFGLLPSATLPEIKQEILDVNNIGSGRKIQATVRGRIDLEGELPIIPIEPRHLRWAFGKAVVTGTTSTTKTATYDPIDKAHLPGLELDAVLKDSPGLRRLYRGVVFRSMEFVAEEGDLFRVNAGLQAFDAINLGTVNPANPPYTDLSLTENGTDVQDFSNDTNFPLNTFVDASNPRPPIFSDIQIKLLSGGVEFCNVRSANIGLDNNVLSQHYLCRTTGRKPNDIINQRPAFSGSVNLYPEDRRIINQLYSGSVPFDAQIEALWETPESTKDLTIRVIAKDCFIESAPMDLPEDGPVEQSVTLHPRTVQMVVIDERTNVSETEYQISDSDLVGLNSP